MKVDAILAGGLPVTAREAVHAEQAGFDGIIIPEVAHDPFLPLSVAAASTTRPRLESGIAVAFARNPMSVAVAASDLHRFSDGRFVLGLGSQVRSHITRRFSMTWSDPTSRMKEYVEAVRAIWSAWETGTPLNFKGDFYQHTLMTPMFAHGPSPCGWPPVHIAAVGPAMTIAAGEVADGLLCHGFTTAAYVRDVTLPNLARGLAKAGRSRQDVEVSLPVMYAIADNDDAPTLDTARSTIAFYGSTPAYRGVLEHHGWGQLGEDLHKLSKEGKWSAMPSLIDNDVLKTLYAVGDIDEVATNLSARFGGIVDRVQIADPGHKYAADLAARLA
jgi:probable F420-dependent oxidoreductase